MEGIMTEAELLQELAVAMRGNDDGVSVMQLRGVLGRSAPYIRNLIRAGLANGQLVRGTRYVETIAGRSTPIAVFSLKKATKRARAR